MFKMGLLNLNAELMLQFRPYATTTFQIRRTHHASLQSSRAPPIPLYMYKYAFPYAFIPISLYVFRIHTYDLPLPHMTSLSCYSCYLSEYDAPYDASYPMTYAQY